MSLKISFNIFSVPQSIKIALFKFLGLQILTHILSFTNTIMYRGLKLCYHLLLLISIFPLKSDATSNIHVFLQLASKSPPLANPQIPLQIPTSPSPSPASPAPAPTPFDLANKGQNVTKPNVEPVVTETCDRIYRACHLKLLTACLGLEGSTLLLRNDNNISSIVNVTILPVNVTYKEMDIPRHRALKINISDSIRGSSSILLEAVNWHCIIDMGAVVAKDNISLQFPSVDTYITPVNGAYTLFALVLIVGGTWTCFKFWKRRRHLEGVPYQELEISHLKLVSSLNVEAAEGWDQVWDDNWDEEKGV